MPGFNYRMTEFQAALGRKQMEKLDRIIAKRRQLASHYDELLSGTNVLAPAIPSESWTVYQSYVVLLPEQFTNKRQEIITTLRKRDVEVNIVRYTCH